MKLVFDTFALMAFCQHEAPYLVVRNLLKEVSQGKHIGYVSVINLGELFYMRYRKTSRHHAEAALRFIRRINMQIEPATYERVMAAANIKAQIAMSYADAFAAALAQELNATLVTGDQEYKPLEPQLNILWL